MVKYKKKVEVGDTRVLTRTLATTTVQFDKGDVVKVTDIGDRGYSILHEPTGLKMNECGWDIFEELWVSVELKEAEQVVHDYLKKSNNTLLSDFKWGSEGQRLFEHFIENVREVFK